jgi:hypothetical protein
MAAYGYFLASWNGVERGKTRMVIWTGEGLIRKYDYIAQAWLDAFDLVTIFSGSPETVSITEAEARETIERNGGNWTTP